MNPYADDETLMRRASEGEPLAREAVVRRVARRVHVVSSAILGHTQDAEDATQAALIQVLRRAGTFRAECRMETWATRIAAREALRLARERRRRDVVTTFDLDALNGSMLERPELATGLAKDIRTYLQDLPEGVRDILVLRHVLEYTVPEISALLGVPANTIKARLTRGRAELRRQIRRDSALVRARSRMTP